MSFGSYCAGVVYFAGTWLAIGAAVTAIVRVRLPQLDRLSALIAWGLLFAAGIMTAVLIPAVLGILTRATMLACAALIALAAWRLAPRRGPAADRRAEVAPPPPPAAPGEHPVVRLLAFAAGAATLLCVLLFLRYTVAQPIQHIDMVAFHLPGVARWIQSGSIWQNDEFLPLLPTGFYPSNGSLVYVSAILPWHNTAFVRIVNVPFLALAVAGMFATARELGAPRGMSALIAAMAIDVPVIMLYAIDRAVPDVILLGTLAAGMLFLVRGLRDPNRWNLVLGGLGLGLAFGTKWYGLSLAIAVGGGWAAATAIAAGRLRAVLARGAVLIGLVVAGGGIWLLRNWIEGDDPFFPARIAPAGVTIFNPPPDPYLKKFDFSLFDRIGQTHLWLHTILPALRGGIGLGGVVLALGVIGALAAALARRRSIRAAPLPAVLMLALSALLVAAAYLVTPATAQGTKSAPFAGIIVGNSRYLMPALILAAPPTAWAFSRLRRAAPALALVAFAGVLDGLAHTFDFSIGRLVGYGALFGIVAAAAAVLVKRLPRPRSRSAQAFAVLSAAILAFAIGQLDQARLNRQGYKGRDAAVDWLLVHAPAGHRVAMAGGWGSGSLESPVLSLFGPRLGNVVAYAGPIDRGMLYEYSSASSFVGALRAGRYDLLLIGRGDPPMGQVPEQTWARLAHFVPVAASDRFVLYRGPSFRA